MSIESSSMPQCVGFIMDGNRRWAQSKKQAVIQGHARGSEVFLEMVRAVRDTGIPHGVFYAFSSENWKRSREEVDGLMSLMEKKLEELIIKLTEENSEERNLRFVFIGERENFSAEMQARMNKLEALGAKDATTTIWIALSYGGREEIVRAVNTAIKEGTTVHEDSFGKLLYTKDMPDPDFIIRTGGQYRLSNFLPWQSVYSEFIFLDILWPDMNVQQFNQTLEEYVQRKRNFGS